MSFSSYDTFDGDFDYLPFVAHLEFGEVPLYPREEDFHNAVSTALRARDVAADWRVEAIRWRRSAEGYGKPLDIKAIAVATAGRAYRKIHEEA